MLDLYGLSLMDSSAIKKEIKRLTKRSKDHHLRCEDCATRKCRDPYRVMLERFQFELSQRPVVTWKTYFVKRLTKAYVGLVKLWR